MTPDRTDRSRRPLLVVGALGVLAGLVIIALNATNPPLDVESLVVSLIIVVAGIGVLAAALLRRT